MKKKFLLFIAFGITVLGAQTNIPLGVEVPSEGINVPRIVKDKFQANHPNAKAKWQMELTNYLADYIDDSTNVEYNVVYDRYANLVRTDKVMDNTSYPKSIEDYYTKYYPDETYIVWYREDHNGERTYYSKCKSGTIWFDKNGKYVSTSNGNKSKE